MTQGSLQNTPPGPTLADYHRWPPDPPASGLASPPLGGQGRAVSSRPATGLLGQVDPEGEPEIGPAVDDGAEAAA
jgi:hypothetical protein